MQTTLIVILIFFQFETIAQSEFGIFDSSKSNNSRLGNVNLSNTKIQNDILHSNNYSFLNLTGQGLVGSALAFTFALPPFVGGFANAWGGNKNKFWGTSLGILTLSSYLFGAAVGVHWVAKAENTNLSLWKTFGYSAIGGGFSTILISVLATKYTTIPPAGILIAMFAPVASSMIYASIVADWPNENLNNSNFSNQLSFKDLVDQSKILDLQLLQIRF